jgi:hypothetical protein
MPFWPSRASWIQTRLHNPDQWIRWNPDLIRVRNVPWGLGVFYFLFISNGTVIVSVADPGSGTFLTPGSRIRNRFFLDPGISENNF